VDAPANRIRAVEWNDTGTRTPAIRSKQRTIST
jgi:hypothetical protein